MHRAAFAVIVGALSGVTACLPARADTPTPTRTAVAVPTAVSTATPAPTVGVSPTTTPLPSVSPSPTVTPAPTSTPVPPPEAKKLLTQMLRTMSGVHQLHSDGTIANTPATRTKGIHVSGNCDYAHKRFKMRLDQPRSKAFVDVVIFKNDAWYRTSKTPAWKEAGSDLDSLMVLFAAICPMLDTRGSGPIVKRVKELGAASVDGVAAWHLRWKGPVGKTTATEDFYVDQRAPRLLRIRLYQHGDGIHYFVDVHYSHFDELVQIKRPKVGSKQP